MSKEQHHTREGAQAIARQIERYWADRGYRVQCRIEERGFSEAMRSARCDVRSDMRNGLPADWQGGAQ